jgi:carboxymethylenebutenolidase
MSGTDRQIETQETVCPGGMPAFVARPAAPGRYPVVVLIHERYGLVPHTRDLAKRCAGDGFLVIAANFFHKHPDQKALNAGDARYPIKDAEAVAHIKAAIAAVEKNPAADMSKVAVAGYCQTGRHPLVYAAQAKIAAAVVWYGAASKREWPV